MTQADVPTFRYRAFISYSHRDKGWADWLHKALETYRVPRRLVGRQTAAGTVPRRLAPVFRDRDELATATDLGRRVNEALAQSANLIVICSPHSAASHWVNEEVRAFRRLGRDEHIFCLIVGGEPSPSAEPGHDGESCFVPALRHRPAVDGSLGEEATEPIAADVRPGADGRTNAKLKLIAGLLGLDFDELKQRELHRRNRRLTAIATVALAVTLLTGLLAIDAVVARRAAERRQQQAEELIGFMLGDLNDKLAQIQRTDVMEAVNDKALAYFEALPATDVTGSALALRVKALEQIGGVRLDQGQLGQAMVAFQAAARLAGTLAGDAPGDVARQIAYSRVLAFIGMTAWSEGRLDLAQRHFEKALDALQRVEGPAAGDPDLLFQRSILDNNMGHVLEARGRIDQAAAAYRRMLAHCQQLVRAKQVKSAWMDHLGLAHNNLGKVALLRGNLGEAIAEYAADNRIHSTLSARNPGDNSQRDNMARVRAILGGTLALAGEVGPGMAYLEEAVDITGRLARFSPDQADFRERTALYTSQLGRLKRLSDNRNAAAHLSARALKTLAAMTAHDPANAIWRQDFAVARLEHAAQLADAGHDGAARAEVRDALDQLESLLAGKPEDRTLVLDTARARLQLADLTSDGAVADALRGESLEATQVIGSSARDPRLLALRVQALLALRRPAEATPLIRQLWDAGYRDPEFLQLLERADIDYPANPRFRQRLQASLAYRG